MTARLSSENLHATSVARDGRAVLLLGPSGSGKSDLALRLFDLGFTLVSDDRTLIRRDGELLIASAPETIRGKLEVRGLGIVEVAAAGEAPVALVAELSSDIARMPDGSRAISFLGLSVPLVSIDAAAPSAAAKLALALDHFGLPR